MKRHLQFSVLIAMTALCSMSNPANAQNLQWARAMGGPGFDMGNSVGVDASGDVYTTGYFNGTADFNPDSATTFNLTSNGVEDIFVSKFDGSGNFSWVVQIGASNMDLGSSLAFDAAGNVYVTGQFEDTVDFDPGVGVFTMIVTGADDAFVLKLDPAGNFVWARQFGGTYATGASITVDLAGNVFTAGHFQGVNDFDPGAGTMNLTSAGAEDVFVSKLDPSGNFLWVKQMGGPQYDYASSVALDAVGSIYTVGYFAGTSDFDPGAGTFNLIGSSTFIQDIYISKLDAAGNFEWAKKIGTASATDVASSVAIDPSGNVYTTGMYAGTVDFNPGTGSFNMTAPGGDFNCYISKLDSLGNFVWAKQVGGSVYDEGRFITTDAIGNVYTMGRMDGTGDFDPGAGVFNFTTNGGDDIFISKLDASGNYIWATTFGGTGSDNPASLDFDANYNIYITGYFAGPMDVDPGPGTYILDSLGGTIDVFVIKFDNPTTGIVEENGASGVKVYPNPSNGIFNVSSNVNTMTEITIWNSLGEKVSAQQNTSGNFIVDLSNQPAGIYFYQLQSDGKNSGSGKIVKE